MPIICSQRSQEGPSPDRLQRRGRVPPSRAYAPLGSVIPENRRTARPTSFQCSTPVLPSPPVRDAAFWAKLDKELEFYYEAEYPGKELEKESDKEADDE